MSDDLDKHKAALGYILTAVRRYLHEPRHGDAFLEDLLRAVRHAERTLKLPEDIWLGKDEE